MWAPGLPKLTERTYDSSGVGAVRRCFLQTLNPSGVRPPPEADDRHDAVFLQREQAYPFLL